MKESKKRKGVKYIENTISSDRKRSSFKNKKGNNTF